VYVRDLDGSHRSHTPPSDSTDHSPPPKPHAVRLSPAVRLRTRPKRSTCGWSHSCVLAQGGVCVLRLRVCCDVAHEGGARLYTAKYFEAHRFGSANIRSPSASLQLVQVLGGIRCSHMALSNAVCASPSKATAGSVRELAFAGYQRSK
jgi:hypothetical protein